ncbi:MAG: hypothetical protein ACOYK7_15440, partial [Pirellulales bacterium]
MAAEVSELSRRAERAGRGLAAMVRWGRSRCRLAIGAAVLVLGWVGGASATAQLTTATWTGAAGDGRYSNPANWSGGVVPINSGTTLYNVVVPFISGKSSLTLDSDVPNDITVNDFTLANGVTLTVNPNRRFTVDDDAMISGLVNVAGGRSQFDSGWALQTPGNTARFAVAQSGTAVVRIPEYSTTGLSAATANYGVLSASGSGSVLDASSIQSWSAAFNDSRGDLVTVQTVAASSGGRIDLSGLTTLTTPVYSEDRVDFIVSTGGQIDLSNLATVGGAGSLRLNVNESAALSAAKLTTANSLAIDLRAGASLSLPELSTVSQLSLNVPNTVTLSLPKLFSVSNVTGVVDGGATVSLPELVSASGFSLNVFGGGAFVAPKLTSLTSSVVSLTPEQTFVTGTLANIDNTRIAVSGGRVWGRSTGNLSDASYSTTGLSAATANYGVLSA